MNIYHIVLPAVWETFQEKDFYEAASLQTEGFIHCSFAEQIDGVLDRYYKGVEKVLILTIDPEKLTSKPVNESSTNNEIYPHIYGPIDRDAIIEIRDRTLID